MEPNESGSPAPAFRRSGAVTLYARVTIEQRVNGATEASCTFAVNHPHLQNATLKAGAQVVRQEGAQVTRTESVQIQRAINGKIHNDFIRFVHTFG